ncbi:hypothetical protein [Flagellimonas nanhaiensis]|uniref:Uncharacterized protein n=1 Tax=Flagellimonas nanhaiensis TaxID=2292706 RepID=A0A371JVW1_9FLAO|nr:hypothetical protein [Allomuricauda nanhaiensis]RDY61961.1 hypothetical protein DX873_07405 [Allomuricauda nanhaiensis]
MKKLTLTLFAAMVAVFYSCEVEPAGTDNLDSIDGKGKLKEKVVEEEICEISLFPDLPAVVNACTTAKGVDANDAYFDLTISDTSLAGDYSAWCVDQDASLEAGECFEAEIYSSYEELPIGAFEKPENFDLVNWLFNQNIIGQASSGGDPYTFGDFQRAIWYLIDDSNCVQCLYLGDWDDDRALELVDLALANGEGYEPGEGDKLAVILIPTNGRQSLFIPYTLECPSSGGCETAYARGNDGNNCFMDNGFSKWGWSIGPLSEGTDESYEIYAAAGQCDINKGELVGTVEVEYADGSVTVTYNIDSSYTVSETHTYAGNDMFPLGKNGKPTVAPGQFTIEEGLSGDIYVIAHAVVCD